MFKRSLGNTLSFMFKRIMPNPHNFDEAKKIYDAGDKQRALLKFKENVNAHQSDKASRIWVTRITKEIESEAKIPPSSTPKSSR